MRASRARSATGAKAGHRGGVDPLRGRKIRREPTEKWVVRPGWICYKLRRESARAAEDRVFIMSRFVNLELGGESEDESRRQGQKTPVKDETYYLHEARTAFENGDFAGGLRYYSKVLEFNPENAAAWTGQVRMLIELGEFREAKLWADKALERFPREPELLAAKAVALSRAGDLQGAIAFSDASIEERGDTPYVWLARGDVLLAREEQRAEKARRSFFRLWPRFDRKSQREDLSKCFKNFQSTS